jgi:subtilisin-like proprotein convertase family protein
MKTLFKIVLLTLVSFSISCSDDEKPVSKYFEVIDETQRNIPDDNSTGIIIPLEVTAEGKLNNLNGMKLHIWMEHTWVGDLRLLLTAPDGTERIFVNRVGLSSTDHLGYKNDFIETNELVFTAAALNTLPVGPDFPDVIPAGEYKETYSSYGLGQINIEPIFSSFKDKEVQGVWELKVQDLNYGDLGHVKKVKLSFAKGALE